jgi:hypothetical protein
VLSARVVARLSARERAHVCVVTPPPFSQVMAEPSPPSSFGNIFFRSNFWWLSRTFAFLASPIARVSHFTPQPRRNPHPHTHHHDERLHHGCVRRRCVALGYNPPRPIFPRHALIKSNPRCVTFLPPFIHLLVVSHQRFVRFESAAATYPGGDTTEKGFRSFGFAVYETCEASIAYAA